MRLPANRAHPGGAAFPTLPILRDPVSAPGDEVIVGDSFDIALHVQDAYLSNSNQGGPAVGEAHRQLFPPRTIALHRAFNAHVDALFSKHGAPLACFHMPFDPDTASSDKQAMLDRIGMGHLAWEDITIPLGSEARTRMVREFEATLDAKLAGCFGSPGKVVGGMDSEGFSEWRGAGQGGIGEGGPFMDGSKMPMYADFIVGGWLQFMRQALPEWEELKAWSGGKWGALMDALTEWDTVDGLEGVLPARA